MKKTAPFSTQISTGPRALVVAGDGGGQLVDACLQLFSGV